MDKELSQLMEDNLKLVWSERNNAKRFAAVEKIYAEDAALLHVGDKTKGHRNISNSAGAVLENMPAEFSFSKLKPVIINNDIGRLTWGVGPDGQPPITTGMDIAHFENGKIKALYVFLDNASD